jgi:hypothetical protein
VFLKHSPAWELVFLKDRIYVFKRAPDT